MTSFSAIKSINRKIDYLKEILPTCLLPDNGVSNEEREKTTAPGDLHIINFFVFVVQN